MTKIAYLLETMSVDRIFCLQIKLICRLDLWQEDLFVGNLVGQYLGHFSADSDDVSELDPLLEDENWRIGDVTVGPVNGYLYVLL